MVEGHCRICGSFKLNKLYYVQNIGERAGVLEILTHNDSFNQLIRPCECRGQFAFAHRVCLSNWIETTKHKYCDVCRYKYNIRYQEKTFFDWIFETEQLEKFLLAAAGVIFIYYLSALGLLVCYRNNRRNLLDVLITTSSCSWLLLCTASAGWYLWHISCNYSHWKVNNWRVLVDENKHPQLDAQYTQTDVLRSSGFKPN